MKTTEYRVETVPFGCVPKDLEASVIYIAIENYVEYSASFLCPCGCGLNTYLPFEKNNNEGGSEARLLFWDQPFSVLSITPSIQVRGGCNSHYHITKNKVIY